MKNVLLSVVVVAVLIAGGVGGTFAGFVDTEISEDNFVQAGIADLLVNGQNDPNVESKFTLDHITPCKSNDIWVDLYNWGKCNGGDVYMQIKDVVDAEAGVKHHGDFDYVFDGTAAGSGELPAGVPPGYRVAVGTEPVGNGVYSSEPEKVAEAGVGNVAGIDVSTYTSCIKGEDYCGVSEHLDVTVVVPLVGASGNILGDPDTNNDGNVDATEEAAWVTAGNRWVIITSLTGKMDTLDTKDHLGFLGTQAMTFVHITVHLQQIPCDGWPDDQTKWWPTDSLQGDKVTWAMLFELITDDPPAP
jgi:hypothetical protein